jgi:succinoglycan biosynthesis transport protein ExoP
MNQQFPNTNSHNDFVDEETIDLLHYWRVLMRFKWGIAGLGLLFAIVTALMVINEDNIYESSATLLIEANKPSITSIEDIYGIDARSREYFSTQFELLKNRNLAERVIRDLDLPTNPEFISEAKSGFSLRAFLSSLLSPQGPQGGTTTAVDADRILMANMLGKFNARLTISPIRNTDLVTITFEAKDPQLAADMANSLANNYIERNLEQRLESIQLTSSWMTDRLSGIRSALDESEQRLQAFVEAEQLVDIEGIAALNIQELDELTTQNNEASRERAESETVYRQIQEIDEGSIAEILSIPAVLNHSAMERVRDNLDDVEQEIADLSQRYGRRHPRMIALNAQLVEVQRTLERQAQQVLGSIDNDYQTAVNNERVTEQRLDQAKIDFQNVNRKNFELRELTRSVETDRELYDIFFTRQRETDQTDDFQATNAIVVDPAIAAIGPSKPRRSMIVATALAAGLMLGVMLAFLRDMLDNTVHSPAEVEERLGSTTLGVIPFVKRDRKTAKNTDHAYMGFADDSHSSFSEALRTIRTGIILSALDNPYKLIEVTSSVPNEGKTTVAINLASVLGQMKSTLLIDADLRRPCLAKSLGLDPHTPGVTNVIAGTAELRDCVIKNEAGGFSCLVGGQMVGNPLELLSSKKFNALIEKLKESFDYIVLDTPPTQAVSDALILASMADATVYVVKADATPINVIKTGLMRLRHANANIVGVTLNQVDTQKQASYYYQGGYYDSYGYTGGKNSPLQV